MRWIFVAFLLTSIASFGQSGKRKPKNAYARGTMYISGGLNRAWYSNADIYFKGSGYDFNLSGVRANDNRYENNVIVSKSTFHTDQISAKIGYNIQNGFAISLGFDRVNYSMLSGYPTLLSGTINPGVDTVTDLSGDYSNETFVADGSKFHYQNSVMSMIRLDASRIDQWYITENKAFALSTLMGLGFGGLSSNTDFLFAGHDSQDVSTFSGFTVSGHAGIRLEFFRQFYLQGTYNGGYLKQMQVRTSDGDPNATAKSGFFYSTLDLALGVFIYVRPTNDCNSCPHW